MTNYKNIKKMSIDEMTEFLLKISICDCCINGPEYNCDLHDTNIRCDIGIKKWLESEAE